MKISWYPGHMNKARKELQRSLPTTSVVIEILDARAPLASTNPLLSEMTSGLPVLKILNKSDLADEQVTSSWLEYFNRLADSRAICSANDKQNLATLVIDSLNQLATTKSDASKRQHALVVGIPNVGKSTVINAITGRKVTKTGNEPAVTKAQQKIKLNDQWMLVDTPGMMWPNLEDQQGALCLALIGSIRQTALDIEDIGWLSAELLYKLHSHALQKRYSLPDHLDDTEALMTAIADYAGALGKSRTVNWHKTAETLLNDFRSGKLGRISLESPPD